MSANTVPSSPLSVGFVCATPLDSPTALSGMPHRMANALRDQGLSVVPISCAPRSPDRPLNLHLAQRYRLNRRYALKRTLDRLAPPITRALVLREAARNARAAQSSLDQIRLPPDQPLDALFGCNISKALSNLRTSLPIIYYSDATAPLIIPGYPRYAQRGRPYRDALIESERRGVRRATTAILASPLARDSAVRDLGIKPEHTRVVPMGAHVTPDDPATVTPPADAPTRERCELLIVAADPIRKRVDLALQATELLRHRGINATLHIVGPGTPRSNTSPAAKPIGRLQLSDPSDRATHQQLLNNCHLQLLPSLGEAFGIAPIESAHFARPSIVSDAGGLPFVVFHNQTGLVLDRDAEADAWADAIESLIDHPDRYAAMSTNALQRARDELNWDAWGRSVAAIIRQTVADHR